MVSCSGGSVFKLAAYFRDRCNSYVIEGNDGYSSNSKREVSRPGAAHGLLIAEGGLLRVPHFSRTLREVGILSLSKSRRTINVSELSNRVEFQPW
jgi:hypothetical protein